MLAAPSNGRETDHLPSRNAETLFILLLYSTQPVVYSCRIQAFVIWIPLENIYRQGNSRRHAHAYTTSTNQHMGMRTDGGGRSAGRSVGHPAGETHFCVAYHCVLICCTVVYTAVVAVIPTVVDGLDAAAMVPRLRTVPI